MQLYPDLHDSLSSTELEAPYDKSHISVTSICQELWFPIWVTASTKFEIFRGLDSNINQKFGTIIRLFSEVKAPKPQCENIA